MNFGLGPVGQVISYDFAAQVGKPPEALKEPLTACHLWKLRNQIKIAHNREPLQKNVLLFTWQKKPWHHPRHSLHFITKRPGTCAEKAGQIESLPTSVSLHVSCSPPLLLRNERFLWDRKHTDQNQEMCTSKTVECCQVIIPKT